MTRRGDEAGVVLVNVLAILALTAVVVTAMVGVADLSIQRSQRYSDAGQALALIAGAEASAIVALRRDMAEAPDTDNLTEGWARVGQAPVAIAAGTFALRIEDAQARVNLNALASGGVASAQILSRLAEVLDLAPDVALRIGARMAQPDPLQRIGDLGREAGLGPDEVASLSRVLTALPGRGPVNLNTAPAEVLQVLAATPVQALRLQGMRERQGVLTQADVAAAGLVMPVGAGFTSQLFRVTVTVRTGGVTLSRESLLQRRRGPGGAPEVVVVARAPAPAPLF